jgi:hypothetical protein
MMSPPAMAAYQFEPMYRDPRRGRVIGGCILVALGLAFSLSLWPIGYLGGASETFGAAAHIGPWMIPGFALFFTGVGLLLAGALRGGALQAWGLGVTGFGLGVSLGLWPIGFIAGVEQNFALILHIGPWMLGGFIPLFIGLALVLAELVLSPRDTPPADRSAADAAHRATLASASMAEG